jgi:hypothetical protein
MFSTISKGLEMGYMILTDYLTRKGVLLAIFITK